MSRRNGPIDRIEVRGAREHNLRGVDVDLPRDALTVVTGVSGSGKSSLAFDTVQREGQRRFLESLSAYARQFLGGMERPRVDRVDGLSPTVAIDQRSAGRNPRSTVGTITEVLDHLRLLLARLGTPHCPECGREISASSPGRIADRLLAAAAGAQAMVLAPVVRARKGEHRRAMERLRARGFVRARVDGRIVRLDEALPELARYERHTVEAVVDRLRLRPEDRPRLVEALELAVALAGGRVGVLVEREGGDPEHLEFSTERACPEHGVGVPEMEPRLFSFNAPQGACPRCAGLGWLEDFDPELLLDEDAPVDRALRPMAQDGRLPFSPLDREVLRDVARRLGIDPDAPLRDVAPDARRRLLLGDEAVRYTTRRVRDGAVRERTRTWAGLLPHVEHAWRVARLPRLARCRRRVTCPACGGRRLNPVALAVTFRGRNVAELSALTVAEARAFFDGLRLSPAERPAGAPILRELRARLRFLDDVGLGYLGLDRTADTLSGGEAQRIRLAAQVGSGLRGVTYVLDEPSIGLHPRDQGRLLDALCALRDRGNTVIVVEHDLDTVARADWLVELGPGAGAEGGRVVAAGPRGRFLRSRALTARFLRGEERIEVPARRRPGSGRWLVLEGARAHNLRDLTLRLPLGTLVAVTGVSGSGKSTLVDLTLYRALAAALHGARARPGAHRAIRGLEHVDKVVRIDQSPIGRTPRSNPATYTGAWTPIRELFAASPLSRARGWKPGRFSFNVPGGRCEECGGAGVHVVEMEFLADVVVPCEACGGRRFNDETLEVRFLGRTISEVLELTVAEAAELFRHHPRVRRVLDTLLEVGLGYLRLGQSSPTLSGGEAQRIKLARELARPSTGRTLYVLDEPTTGLHAADVRRLLDALGRLVDAGNTVVVIEHNMDVVKVADHVVDLGPEGGDGGGRIVGEGPPEAIARLDTPTGRALARALAGPPGLPPARRRSRRGRGRARAIELRGVRTHNLRGIDVDVPLGRLTVVTGPSGSGKSSLALDTLFAEGQRRYVESLSTYARRFLRRAEPPPLDRAEGLLPAIAIDQRNRSNNPRSTVATVTEIHDQLRLLWARAGHPHCPECGRPLRPRSPIAAARELAAAAPGRGWLLAAVARDLPASRLRAAGYARAWRDGREEELDALGDAPMDGRWLVVDRLDPARAPRARLAESVAAAYELGRGRARFVPRGGGGAVELSREATCPEHGRALPGTLDPRLFSFNSAHGACPECSGLGRRLEVDPALLLPRPDRPLEEALDRRVAAVVLRSPRNRALLATVFARHGVPADAPVEAWPEPLRRAVLHGHDELLAIEWSRERGRHRVAVRELRAWPGLVPLVERWTHPAAWLRRERTCPACGGARLRREVLAVRVLGRSIAEATAMTVDEARRFWSEARFEGAEAAIAEQPVRELRARLDFLARVGLGYLGLDRPASTLSGGEAQRIRLATQLGSRLTSTLYVLDEPTVGLHPRDTDRLLGTLRGLVAAGNTVVVVEHDPAVIRAADHVVDLGPGAGEHGGRVLFAGPPERLAAARTPTGDFLSGRRRVPRPERRRAPRGWVRLPPARVHNLKDVAVSFPRGALTVVTGVSGSGKSTLVFEVLAPHLRAGTAGDAPRRVVVVEQQPSAPGPRSTPATFVGAWDPIRRLFAETPLARRRGWGPGRFSFNAGAGRCPDCEGRGRTRLEMHFLPDVWVRCDACGGRRFTRETLEVRYLGLDVAAVLDLPVDEALDVFARHRAVVRPLRALADVGLGYLRLGQPLDALSGGERQRLHLARELVARPEETAYLLDEPTTGLHLVDVERLLAVLHRLADAGHMVVVVEHHLDVIAAADHVVDLGPEGGDAGGRVLCAGPPEAVAACPESHTGRFLRADLDAGGAAAGSRAAG